MNTAALPIMASLLTPGGRKPEQKMPARHEERTAAATRRVEASCTLLNDHRGDDWWKEINIKSLDVQQGCHCVLGQLYGVEGENCPYTEGCADLSIDVHEQWGEHAFNAHSWNDSSARSMWGEPGIEYGYLNVAWRKKIKKLRAA